MRPLLLTLVLLLAGSAMAQVPSDVELQPVPGISGLSAPLGLKHAGDGSGRIFVVEQGGTVRIIDSEGNLVSTPFIDVSARVAGGFEQGLLDIAFHPQFDSNGRFFIHYSTSANQSLNPPPPPGTLAGDTVVAQFSVGSDPDIANQAPEQFILTVRQDFENHNGGQMKFGPDGYLYIGLGDGGGANDRCNRAQTLDPSDLLEPGEASCPPSAAALDPSRAMLGKMLRVDVDNPTLAGANNLCAANGDGSANYSIPPENPFFEQDDRCGEVLLYGLRNPWRWSFDRQTQDLWIGDVGQATWEEIDLLPWPLVGGDNLGWKICEGSWLTGSTNTACTVADSILPVLEYRRSDGNCSVTGGYRYRGFIRSLQARYIYGDFCSGRIWFADDDSGAWQAEVFASDFSNLRSFGEDEIGNLYAIAGSQLYRFIGEEIFLDDFED